MPQINRIRVNNVKYNFGTQYYDDFMMRFNCRNTLYDLANGGGKSLLMLLLLQNVIPNCTLDEKQPIEKLFRQGSGNTVIHSLVEWKLDSCYQKDNYKYMTTGFCARKAGDAEKHSGEHSGVEYFNYCIFYREFGDNDIKNLPLTVNGERITYQGLKDYLRELEKKDFNVSVKIFDRKGEYQHFISQYGLYESEWEMIRGINKTEGHVRTYFETNYKTSRKVVEDLLIEEIIQKAFYNRMSEGDSDKNDESVMAQTLMDIKEKLVQLSRKQAQITNYDRQTAVMEEFAEYVSGYTHLYEEKEQLKGQLYDMLIACKVRLSEYRKEESHREEEKKRLEAENVREQMLVRTAEVISEENSLKNVQELIAANETVKNSLNEQKAELTGRLDLMEAAEEYREYRSYEKLEQELKTAIGQRSRGNEELAAELTGIANAVKSLMLEKEDKLINDSERLKAEADMAAQAAADAEAEYDRKREYENTQKNRLEFVTKNIEEKEERAAALMERSGLLVIEKVSEELSECQRNHAAAVSDAEGCEKRLSVTGENLRLESGKLEALKVREAHCKNKLEEYRGKLEICQQAEQQLEKLKNVYAENDTGKIASVILENYRKMELESLSLQQESMSLAQFIANTKQGAFAETDAFRVKVKQYLTDRYGDDVKEGQEWLAALPEEKRNELAEKFPYIEHSFVIEGDFTRLQQDKVLEDFGRSGYVIPVISAEILLDDMSVGHDLSGEVFVRKSLAFLKDEAKRRHEAELAGEELENTENKLKRLSDRKTVVWNDYIQAQRCVGTLDEAKPERLRELEAEAKELSNQVSDSKESIDVLQKEEIEISQRLKDIRRAIQDYREQESLLKETEQLSEQIKECYKEKRQISEDLSEAADELLCLNQKKNEAVQRFETVSSQAEQTQKTLLQLRKDRQIYEPYCDEKFEGQAYSGQDISELESRFAGLKMAIDGKNADTQDKEALLKQYLIAMDKCKKNILQKHFTIEEIAERVSSGACETLYGREAELKRELDKVNLSLSEIDGELEAQNGLMNRLEGSIAHGISRIEENYGSYEAFVCENPEQFILQHKQQIKHIAGRLEELKGKSRDAAKLLQDFIVMEKDLERIVEKAGLEVPQHVENLKVSETTALTDYEKVQKEFDRLCRLEFRKLEEFAKKKEKLIEQLKSFDAGELAEEVRLSVNVPSDIEQTKQLAEHIRETNTFIGLEKERIGRGIEDMERIKENFESRCIQTCCNIKTELDRLPKMSCITLDNEKISMIGLKIPYVKEEEYKERMSSYIDETVMMAESFESEQDRLKYIRNRLTWKRLFSVIVTDMNLIRVNLYKRERIKDQSRYLRYEEAVGSTGQSQGIYIQFFIAVVNYISSVYTMKSEQSVIGKTIFIDNPFGAAKDIYIWEPIFQLLKTNHVQLIVPARGATPAIMGRFDVNYILGQKLVDNRQQTVVVDYYSRTKNEELEYTRMDYEQAVFEFL